MMTISFLFNTMCVPYFFRKLSFSDEITIMIHPCVICPHLMISHYVIHPTNWSKTKWKSILFHVVHFFHVANRVRVNLLVTLSQSLDYNSKIYRYQCYMVWIYRLLCHVPERQRVYSKIKLHILMMPFLFTILLSWFFREFFVI